MWQVMSAIISIIFLSPECLPILAREVFIKELYYWTLCHQNLMCLRLPLCHCLKICILILIAFCVLYWFLFCILFCFVVYFVLWLCFIVVYSQLVAMYVCSFSYHIAGKFGGGKVLRIWWIIMIWQTKTIQITIVFTINNLLADLLIHQSFFHQMLEKSQFASANFPAIWYVFYVCYVHRVLLKLALYWADCLFKYYNYNYTITILIGPP